MFILGTIYGSFIKCILDNYPNYLSHKRSVCPNCHHTLKLCDLIPIYSFLSLKGRCRYCNIKLSINYLYYEIVFGIIFLSYYLLPFNIFIILIMLISLSISDYKFGIIYDTPLIIILIIIILTKEIYFSLAISTLIIGSVLSYKGLIGFGDIKLLSIFNLYLSLEQFLLAILIACILAIIKERNRLIYFAPYLSIGLFFVMVT